MQGINITLGVAYTVVILICASGCAPSNQWGSGLHRSTEERDIELALQQDPFGATWQSRAVIADVHGHMFHTLYAASGSNHFTLHTYKRDEVEGVTQWVVLQRMRGNVDRDTQRLHSIVVGHAPEVQALPDDYHITYEFRGGGDVLVLNATRNGRIVLLGEEIPFHRVRRLRWYRR